jgi:hypothetical protein
MDKETHRHGDANINEAADAAYLQDVECKETVLESEGVSVGEAEQMGGCTGIEQGHNKIRDGPGQGVAIDALVG